MKVQGGPTGLELCMTFLADCGVDCDMYYMFVYVYDGKSNVIC